MLLQEQHFNRIKFTEECTLKKKKRRKKKAKEKMHPVEPWSLVGAGQWAVCLHGRDFPVSGSRLLSTEQMPPENIKRKRKETVKSLYF